MEIKLEKLTELKREVKITLAAPLVVESYNKSYQKLKEQVSIKGFRKGKIPQSVIESRYKQTMQEEVMKDLVNKYLSQAIKEKKLKVVTQPKVKTEEITKGKPFIFTTTFEIFPEFDLPVFNEQIKLQKATWKIEQQEIDNYANLLCLQAYTYEPKTDAIKDKDQVSLKLHFKKVANQKEDRQADIFYYVGSNEISEQLDKSLLGMKVNETKTVQLKVSPYTLSRDIAGKDVELELTVLAIATPLPATKDKAFYQKINSEITDETSLKNFSKKALKSLKERDSEFKEKAEIREQLIENANFEVPEENLKDKIDYIKKQEEQKGVKDQPEEELKKQAIDSLRYQFILAKIIEDSKIEVSQNELNASLQQLAISNGLDLRKLSQSNYGQNMANMLRQQIEENKALDLIRKEVKRI